MQFDTVTPMITRFNNLIDSLINDFKEFNLDEETVAMLATKTRNFISFTELALLNVNFKILENVNGVKYIFDDEIEETKKMVNVIFEEMNKSLDHILEHEDEEEHGHDHSHEHHHHVDIDNVQEDIFKIVDALEFLKQLLGEIGVMVISVVKYQCNEITEEEFDKEYSNFKEKINNYKTEFETKIL